MTETYLIFDGETLAASGDEGDTIESEEFSVTDKENLKIQLIGDGSSTNLTGTLKARCDPNKNVFGPYKELFSGKDLTSNDENSDIVNVDVDGLTAVKLELVNGAASTTDVDVTGGANDK